MNFPAQARTQAVPGRCALIVDADPQVTSALGSVFEPEQWAILHAPDNREALKLAEARAFDLIITGAKSKLFLEAILDGLTRRDRALCHNGALLG